MWTGIGASCVEGGGCTDPGGGITTCAGGTWANTCVRAGPAEAILLITDNRSEPVAYLGIADSDLHEVDQAL